jgi:hypothetical protein
LFSWNERTQKRILFVVKKLERERENVVFSPARRRRRRRRRRTTKRGPFGHVFEGNEGK